MTLEKKIAETTASAIQILYKQNLDTASVQVEKTNREFSGDYTVIVFPLLKLSRKPPLETGEEIGSHLIENMPELKSYNVIKGFLNLSIDESYWVKIFQEIIQTKNFGSIEPAKGQKPIILEYSSPNTNKPLHLGHIRNNLLGYSIAEILKANGKNVIRLNLVNDRGIHICKSMLAWIRWGNGETPESSGLKGDHLIGKYYVLFDRKHKEQIEKLVHLGNTNDDAFNQAPLMREAQDLLKKWEEADEEVLSIWRLLNDWAYEGFKSTYDRLGIEFDKTDYESKTYLLGKEIVERGLYDGVFQKKPDGSVWADLSDEGLDEKLLLRSDGTSVYITQDLGTAESRYLDFMPEKLIYVVGNEQIYHFEVLKKLLKKLGNEWYNRIFHLSYGMVELPSGRMKSREGTVVDADDLMDEMFETAVKTTGELGKTESFSKNELKRLNQIVSMGALKYFILKVDPKKNMLFNPEESIDFNGNTGPFIQYTFARIQSVIRKSGYLPEQIITQINYSEVTLTEDEKEIIKTITEFPLVVSQAAELFNPSIVANYCYDLARKFNHFYQDQPILMRISNEVAIFRVALSWFTGNVLKKGMFLLGIELPEKM